MRNFSRLYSNFVNINLYVGRRGQISHFILYLNLNEISSTSTLNEAIYKTLESTGASLSPTFIIVIVSSLLDNMELWFIN